MNVHSLSNLPLGRARLCRAEAFVPRPFDGSTESRPATYKRRFVNRRSLMSPQEVKLPQEVIARFPPTRRHLVGVSGGRDSVALVHALVHSGYRRLIVCHLDHQLRGRASAVDAKFVKSLA